MGRSTHVGLLYDLLPYLFAVDTLINSGTASPGRLPSTKCNAGSAPYVTLLDVALNVAVLATNFAAQALLCTKVTSEPALMAYAT